MRNFIARGAALVAVLIVGLGSGLLNGTASAAPRGLVAAIGRKGDGGGKPKNKKKADGWIIAGGAGGDIGSYQFFGKVCDLEKPFELDAGSTESQIKGTFTFTPTSRPSGHRHIFHGTYSFAGAISEKEKVTANGNFIIIAKLHHHPGDAQLNIDGGKWTLDFPAPVGPTLLGPGGRHLGAGGDLLLKNDPGMCKA